MNTTTNESTNTRPPVAADDPPLAPGEVRIFRWLAVGGLLGFALVLLAEAVS